MSEITATINEFRSRHLSELTEVYNLGLFNYVENDCSICWFGAPSHLIRVGIPSDICNPDLPSFSYIPLMFIGAAV